MSLDYVFIFRVVVLICYFLIFMGRSSEEVSCILGGQWGDGLQKGFFKL